MKLPFGHEDFKELIDNHFDFVDKSLFIQEILEDNATKVALITRPRRFGKTLNLSMLHHFLAAEVNSQSTKGLFDNLKIAKLGDKYMQHQGRYPVVFVTFKDVKDGGFEHAFQKIKLLMMKVYEEHKYLLTSSRMDETNKRFFEAILNMKADQPMLEAAIERLTFYLYHHHGVKPWVLIDEYDTPIQSSYLHGYYPSMVNCIRNLLGSALKTNPYLNRAVITGVLRIAKESLFSGLNNLEVYSLIQSQYGQWFGFTEEEVMSLLKRAGLEQHALEVRDWYNGYQMGKWTVYNPWSIVRCIRREGELAPHWINTSDNRLIRDLLVRSSETFRIQFENLMRGELIEKVIDETVVFDDLKNNETAAWSLLLMSGYLKVTKQQRDNQGLWATLAIPNQEVRNLYRSIIEQWLSNDDGVERFNQFLNHLLTGNLSVFAADLKYLVEETFSVHDTSRDPEAFYHGFMVGVTANLYHNKNYEIKSNRESGYGRYDYLIFSHDLSKPTILIEIKRLSSAEKSEAGNQLDEALVGAAKQALDQIKQQNYLSEAKQRGRTYLLKIGLAFCGKRFNIQFEEERG